MGRIGRLVHASESRRRKLDEGPTRRGSVGPPEMRGRTPRRLHTRLGPRKLLSDARPLSNALPGYMSSSSQQLRSTWIAHAPSRAPQRWYQHPVATTVVAGTHSSHTVRYIRG